MSVVETDEGVKQTVVALTRNIGVPTQETVMPKDDTRRDAEVELANSGPLRHLHGSEAYRTKSAPLEPPWSPFSHGLTTAPAALTTMRMRGCAALLGVGVFGRPRRELGGTRVELV